MTVPMLATISPELQVKICTLLHPSDILSLRKTCRALLMITKERLMWIAVIRRICIDNALFLPSFPIDQMSTVEIERATIAPHRWIRRCTAWAKKPRNLFRPKQLNPITTRNIRGPLDGTRRSKLMGVQTFLVPGGRYLLANSPRGMSLWDLGLTSNADCKLVASVEWDDDTEGCSFIVNATPDGMGLIIVVIRRHQYCSVYEIYPLENETPQFTRIAQNSHLEVRYPRDPWVLLMPNKVVYCISCGEKIVFRVWDYRLNLAMNFLADFDVPKFDYLFEAIATESMIIIIYEEAIFVWSIPPLSPQPLDNFDKDTIPIPLLRRVPFPDDILLHHGLYKWVTMSSWYSGSSSSSSSSSFLYFDALCHNGKLYAFEIVIDKNEPNDLSLRLINFTPLRHTNDVSNMSNIGSSKTFGGNGICENTLVSVSASALYFRSIASYTDSSVVLPATREHKASDVMNVHLSVTPATTTPAPRSTPAQLSSLCSASGRFVYPDVVDEKIVILDFL